MARHEGRPRVHAQVDGAAQGLGLAQGESHPPGLGGGGGGCQGDGWAQGRKKGGREW